MGGHDKNKLHVLGKVKRIRLERFVAPDRGRRADSVWNHPNEIQAACKNACIEQQQNRTDEDAKHDKPSAS
ncbi:hypothetical protein OWM54_09490 [Myxococcus sp. MISCRS1]|uniref:hypothetical protein n=1 Tax=Myxococcus sp. MISCRS1 TaxID=2996786 RepID=UPI00226D75C0|nr:hypothetical protein [Myxococcus sp. MISCRS1]MCY0997366.1 hypothetical protein [Myxococcus sp. MISCRS1]BDT32626.1 hypothetical protein MFMH1_22950 [Myxococcus sp. MH1]